MILRNWKNIGKNRRILFWFSMLNYMERSGLLYRRNWEIKETNIPSKTDSNHCSRSNPRLKCGLSTRRNWLIVFTQNVFRAKRKKQEATHTNRKAQTLPKQHKSRRRTQITLFLSFRKRKMSHQWEISSIRTVQAAERNMQKSLRTKTK